MPSIQKKATRWIYLILNNSELYPHEAVHFYTLALFPNSNKVVGEGYATYMGGSGGLPLEKLVTYAKDYLKQHPKADLCNLATDFDVRVEENIVLTYILSAVVCQDVEQRMGMEGTRKLFTSEKGEDYFTILKKTINVDKDSFPGYLQRLLDRYSD